MAIYQGDIIIGTAEAVAAATRARETPQPPGFTRAVRRTDRRWPNGIVPYKIDPEFEDTTAIHDGMDLFRPATNIRFIERTDEPNFVVFKKSSLDVCNSHVGMQGGEQGINLSASGCGKASIAHEICHALGLEHEHTRLDRDNFVTIHWENVKGTSDDGIDGRNSAPAFNFLKQNAADHEDFGSYDYDSIMHYPRKSFSKNFGPTITPKPNPLQPIGQNVGLSAGDIAVLNDMYPPVSMPLGEFSDTGPAAAERFGKVLIAWKGRENESINTISSRDGLNFSGKVTLGEQTRNAPALAVSGDRYVMAWTGAGNDQLNVMQSDDGATWDSKVTLGDTSPSPPSLGTAFGSVFLAWRGGDDRINLTRSFDGRNWLPKITLDERTESGPAICGFGTQLMLAWRGQGNNNLNILPFNLTLLPGPKTTIAEFTDDRPTLCTTAAPGPIHLLLGWRGTGNSLVNVARSDNGVTWTDKLIASETCLGGPAISTFGSRLIRAWTDDGADNLLQTMLFSPP